MSEETTTVERAHTANNKARWKFHVSLKEKKRKGWFAQLKFGKHVLIEGPTARAEEFAKLAKAWNAEGRRMTTRAEYIELAAITIAELKHNPEELNFGGPTLPFVEPKKPE
jgi:hypothetical protein